MKKYDLRNPTTAIEKHVITPLKGLTPYGWHLEQNIVDPRGKTYALKSSEGSGNRIKVLLYEDVKE